MSLTISYTDNGFSGAVLWDNHVFYIYSELNTHRIRICSKYLLLRSFPAVESEGNYKTRNNERMCSSYFAVFSFYNVFSYFI